MLNKVTYGCHRVVPSNSCGQIQKPTFQKSVYTCAVCHHHTAGTVRSLIDFSASPAILVEYQTRRRCFVREQNINTNSEFINSVLTPPSKFQVSAFSGVSVEVKTLILIVLDNRIAQISITRPTDEVIHAKKLRQDINIIANVNGPDDTEKPVSNAVRYITIYCLPTALLPLIAMGQVLRVPLSNTYTIE